MPPIERYVPVGELTVITTYFNPCHYERRKKNHAAFADSLRESGIPCVTVECAFNDDPFDLPDSLDIVRVRSDSVVWQKERLLNLAASWLPRSCRYVAWLDCDILFTNPEWATETARLLERHPVVQAFETCLRLKEDNMPENSTDRVRSFGSIVPNDRSTIDSGNFENHGHTGYGWAMRKELFDAVGLYEHAICGTADHLMAHAIYGDCGFCIRRAFKNNARQIRHFAEWSARFHPLASDNLGVVSGEILHLWHGDLANRRYALRMQDLATLKYDSYQDVVMDPGQPIRWHPDMKKPELKEYFVKYFKSRQEDG